MELALQHDQLSSLDSWHVIHRITAGSPLWPIRSVLATHLKSIDVSLTAYDPAFNQPVKLYARYAHEEILHDCHFEPMDSVREGVTASERARERERGKKRGTWVAHAALSSHTMRELPCNSH